MGTDCAAGDGRKMDFTDESFTRLDDELIGVV
jgi:hypothetical protein